MNVTDRYPTTETLVCPMCGWTYSCTNGEPSTCPNCDRSKTKHLLEKILEKDLDKPLPESYSPDPQIYISVECENIKQMLLEKNRKYGNSAIVPMRIFSKANNIEQINVRIDDKLSRIASAQMDDTEDAELDLIGYLILKRVAKNVGKTNEK
jgi:hypothetical protein